MTTEFSRASKKLKTKAKAPLARGDVRMANARRNNNAKMIPRIPAPSPQHQQEVMEKGNEVNSQAVDFMVVITGFRNKSRNCSRRAGKNVCAFD
jgi:hypothetical protein